MKKTIETVNPVAAPASTIWSLIRTGEGVDKWFPIITSCRVEGKQRFCTTADGELNETIVRSDDEAMVFQYSIPQQNLFPVSNILGTMTVEAVDANNCNLRWDVEFDLENEALYDELKQGISGLYAQGAQGLGQLASEAVA